MELVDRKNRSCWVIDGFGQGLDGDVDNHAERECGILLQCPFAPKRDRIPQCAFVDLVAGTANLEQRISGRNEITDARNQRDDSADPLRFDHQHLHVHR